MDSSFWDDFDPMIQNRAMEQIVIPMTIQFCHLLISVERKDVQNKALASLQKMAGQLAIASEEFVHVASSNSLSSSQKRPNGANQHTPLNIGLSNSCLLQPGKPSGGQNLPRQLLSISMCREKRPVQVLVSCHTIRVKEAANLGSSASVTSTILTGRLAGDSEEEWLRVEMKPVAESLSLSGRSILLVTQKLHLQPEDQCHWEELVATAQQILVDTKKVLLLDDAAAVRKTVTAASWCLTCLEALEAAEDATSLRTSLNDLAAALLRLGRLTARWAGDERLGPARHHLGCCVPALLAAARGHLRHPHDSQLVASRRRVFALTGQSLGELLDALLPCVGRPSTLSQNGALARGLCKLRKVLEEPGPSYLLDAPLAAVVWHCLRLAACSAPQERMHLVSRCRQLLHLRPGVNRFPRTSPGTECEALWAATDALFRAVRAGLLRQILDTFTDTQSPLERLVQAFLATSTIRSRCDSEALAETLPLLHAFHNQAKQMIRVAHLVWACCPQQQTGRDVEDAVAGIQRLVIKVKELFSQSPQTLGLNWSPATLQALLEAWARESENLLSCFDVVLNIPEFLSLSIQEMTKHLDLYTRALRSGASREFSRSVAFLRGRATHIVQVMSRYVGQDPDPIFRNGMRVVVQQLAQSSVTLGAAIEGSGGEDSAQDTDVFLTMAKHLIYSAQQVHEGLDGTNHPDILSPLRVQVQRSDMAKGWSYFILPSPQHPTASEMKHQQVPGLWESGPNTSFLPVEQVSYTAVPGTCIHGWGSPFPAVSKGITTMENRNHQALTLPCIKTPEQDSTVDTVQEIQAGEETLGPEGMTRLQEFSTLAPSIIDLGREEVHNANTRSDELLEIALQLSERSREDRQDLVARAGDWYRLCQQLFCRDPVAELPANTAAFVELQQDLALMIQVAANHGPANLDRKSPDLMGHPGLLLELRDRSEKTKIHAKQLLDQVLSSDGLQEPTLREENIDKGCLLWAVAVQDLMQCMERLSRRQGLFLRPLRQAVKSQQGLQEGLRQAAEISQRLQEAATLSSVLCGDAQVKGEISFLCGEVHVLTDALLEVAHILVSSPKPCFSLSTRFELLCLELSLRAKALTDGLTSINAAYEQMFQDAVGKNSQNRIEGMLSALQAVQGIIAGSQESGPFQKDLLESLESILMLTKEVAKKVPVLQEEQRLHMLGWLQWEWAAKVHHAVTQLQALEGSHTEAWRLLVQYLKPREEQAKPLEEDPAQLRPHCKDGTAGTTSGGSVDSQSIVLKGTPESSMGTCADELATIRTTTADMSMVGYLASLIYVHLDLLVVTTDPSTFQGLDAYMYNSHKHQSGGLSLPPAQMDQTAPEDGGADPGNRITQITQEMATEVLLMAQSLRKRGRVLLLDQEHAILGERLCIYVDRKGEKALDPFQSDMDQIWTKDQLIASARKVSASGKTFTRLIDIIAKNCIDQRCSQELLCMVEQIQTMSSQLSIISSVKASLTRSKSSEELLVDNAQRLLQAVSATMRAVEAACLRGLRWLSSDPEELEVAAFCTQWKRKLLQHRLQEASNEDCDELGLRKTSTRKLPALAALVREAL
ncbi:Vinculin/alpha-catenin family member 1 [Apodemus speciosus]|uniref:Vinculin/alpha-catenin family member 1 n=1 Tax=Apodemus speciosus TaxID=105296 RepID=A0ABQ0EJ78_APOSI